VIEPVAASKFFVAASASRIFAPSVLPDVLIASRHCLRICLAHLLCSATLLKQVTARN
jgi:hypothetical protein